MCLVGCVADVLHWVLSTGQMASVLLLLLLLLLLLTLAHDALASLERKHAAAEISRQRRPQSTSSQPSILPACTKST
jgi:hypothetical protein